MSVQLTIRVPDETYRVAEHFAASTGQSVEEIVANLLGYALPLIPAIDPTRAVSTLSDAELMALTAITMTPEADRRHSELLARQGEGQLSAGERAELQRLQQVYEIALLYKKLGVGGSVQTRPLETIKLVSYIPDALRERVTREAKNRCGYCLCQQQYSPVTLEIEHILPLAKGGTDEEHNLWLACRTCNNFKRDQIDAIDAITAKRTLLFNPRRQNWVEHFEWSKSGTEIIGKTAIGRATVDALNLNNDLMVTVRGLWVQVGWHPPRE